jgi:hypothetical protein
MRHHESYARKNELTVDGEVTTTQSVAPSPISRGTRSSSHRISVNTADLAQTSDEAHSGSRPDQMYADRIYSAKKLKPDLFTLSYI